MNCILNHRSTTLLWGVECLQTTVRLEKFPFRYNSDLQQQQVDVNLALKLQCNPDTNPTAQRITLHQATSVALTIHFNQSASSLKIDHKLEKHSTSMISFQKQGSSHISITNILLGFYTEHNERVEKRFYSVHAEDNMSHNHLIKTTSDVCNFSSSNLHMLRGNPHFFPLFLSPAPPKVPFCWALALSSLRACNVKQLKIIVAIFNTTSGQKKCFVTVSTSHLFLILLLLNVGHVNLLKKTQ